MIQYVYTKTYPRIENYNQPNQNLLNNQYNNENYLQRNNKKKLRKAKKSVKFNEQVQIDFVESWKKYNIDTSCDNEFIKEKNKLIDLKRKALSGNMLKHDECTCNIY